MDSPTSYLCHRVTNELVETSVIDLGVNDSVVERALGEKKPVFASSKRFYQNDKA